jgi:hypothetical protein
MGVDTNQGVVYQYTIDSTGALLLSPTSFNVGSGAVGASRDGSNLYALSANAVGHVSGSPTGGHVDQYAIGRSGLLVPVSTTTIVGGLPTAMTLVVAH